MTPDAGPDRVVVTGIGVATALGLDVETLWGNIIEGRSGVRVIRRYDSRAFPVRVGGEIETERMAEDPVDGPLLEADRTLRFAKWAATRAWESAGLADGSFDPSRCGVCVGAGVFPAVEARFVGPTLQTKTVWPVGTGTLSDALAPCGRTTTVSSLLSNRLGLRGPSLTVHGACASGTQAIGQAFEMIRRGSCVLMLAGGSDSMMSAFSLAGFTLLGALSTHPEPESASRPFDLTRNGFVLGEGAGMVVLESLRRAVRRGARVDAEVIGYGSTSDGYRFTDVHPDGRGAVGAMRLALGRAGVRPEEVDYINTHGTGTPQNDRVENLAVREAFGSHADRLALSSTKSHLGHLVCAAGAVEFVLSVLTLKTGVMPATINLHRRDPECDLDYIPLEARAAPARVALTNSFGFGGQNGTIAIRRWDG